MWGLRKGEKQCKYCIGTGVDLNSKASLEECKYVEGSRERNSDVGGRGGISFLFNLSLKSSLHTRVWTEAVVHYEVIQHLHPRRVVGKVVIVLRRNFLHLKRNKHRMGEQINLTSFIAFIYSSAVNQYK